MSLVCKSAAAAAAAAAANFRRGGGRPINHASPPPHSISLRTNYSPLGYYSTAVPCVGIYFFILFIFEPSVSTGIAVIEGRFDGDDEPIRCRVNCVVYKLKSS